MRVVLDTNILISACLKPGGLEARVVSMALLGSMETCITEEILAEYRDVLTRERFRVWRSVADELLSALSRCAILVAGGACVQASVDDDDNRFLECAASGCADYLVTGNLRHYPEVWGQTRVVNARAFLDVIATTERTDCRPDL